MEIIDGTTEIIINEFLKLYEDKNPIVADECRLFYNTFPIVNQDSFFIKDCFIKSYFFQKKVNLDGVNYIVKLNFVKYSNEKSPSDEFLFIKNNNIEKTIYISQLSESTLNKLNSIFQNKNIISPLNKEKTFQDKTIDDLICFNEFKVLMEGIKQDYEYLDCLFLMDYGSENSCEKYSNYGTLLYQLLLKRRILKSNDLLKDKEIIKELNKLIITLPLESMKRLDISSKTSGIIKLISKGHLLFNAKSFSSGLITTEKLSTIENGELDSFKYDYEVVQEEVKSMLQYLPEEEAVTLKRYLKA